MLFQAIFTVLLVSQNAAAGINPFCKTATYQQLCNQMVKGADNLHDATLNSINVAIRVAKRFDTMNPAIDEGTANLDPNIKAQIIKICSDSFSSTLDDLNLSIQLLNKGDMGGLGTRLSASFDSTCADSLKERSVSVPALDKLNVLLSKVLDSTMAVAFQN